MQCTKPLIMPTKNRRDREKEALRTLILESASSLFQEVGYEGTTLRKIAKRIEYNPATIYSYFKSKEEIFYALQKQAFQGFYQALQTVGKEPDPGKRLTSMGRAYIKFALDNPQAYDLMFVMQEPMQALGDEEGWVLGEKNFHLLHDTVVECIAAGLLSPEDSESLAMMIWAMMHGLVSLYIRDRCVMFEEHEQDFILRNAFTIFDRILLKKYPNP